MPKKRGPGRPPKRTSEARPKTCAFCGERHYVSIVCEARTDAEREAELAALRPPPRPGFDSPGPVSMPSLASTGLTGEMANQRGALPIQGRVREWENVRPNPSWEVSDVRE